MDAKTRRQTILNILLESSVSISATKLANALNVSRQIIVGDIALLRAQGYDIDSTNRGYIMKAEKQHTRVFKNYSTDLNALDEYNLIVDCGGIIKDVFVYHKVYGVVRVALDLRSRLDVKRYMEALKEGSSTSLQNITNGYHYITVETKEESLLDVIQDELNTHGFLAKLQDYEPVDFWSKNTKGERA